MTTFIAFLEELEQNRQTVALPATEVERLVGRFGSSVRSMGHRSQEGAVEIQMGNITEALRVLNDSDLSAAVAELKTTGQFSDTLNRRCASRLIETLAQLHLRQFQKRVEQFQASNDPAEADRLWNGIIQDLFGSSSLDPVTPRI